MNNEIIVVCGFSNSGKDTVARIIQENFGYNFVVSTCTRPMRIGESQDEPYNFTNNELFEKLIESNSLIEHRAYETSVGGLEQKWYYGVENHAIKDGEKYVIVLDIIGLKGFKEAFGDRVVSFFLNSSEETRKERCISRGDFDETEWNRRLKDDKEKFTLSVINKEVDFAIESYVANKTVAEIMVEVKRNDKI